MFNVHIILWHLYKHHFAVARADRYRKRGYDYLESKVEDDPIVSLERTIFNLGNPHPTLTLEEDVKQTATIICSEYSNASKRIVECLVSCVIELPHKLNWYVMVAASVDKDLLTELFKGVIEVMRAALNGGGPWRHFVQGLSFLCACGGRGLVRTDSLGQLINELASNKNPFVLWSLGASLPLMGNAIDTLLVIQQVDSSLSSLARLPIDVLGVWRCLKSHSFSNGMSCQNIEPIELPSVELLTNVIIDPTWDGDFQPFRLFADSFPTDLDEWQQWRIVYMLRVLVEAMELNHRRCAEFLLQAAASEKIVVEFLLGELIRTRRNGMPVLVYESLLMDCCRLNKAFPPVMARGLNLIFEQLDVLGFTATDRLASWFAHHLSNFELRWNWSNWQTVLEKPATSMMSVFVKLVIERLVRLSYVDRVAPTLPEEFRIFLPLEPVPIKNFAEDDPVAIEIIEAIQSRKTPEEIKALSGVGESPDSELLLQALLFVGSKSLSHTLAIIERYLPLFQLLNAGEDKMASNLKIIEHVAAFWKNSPLHWEFVIERLINYRIILPKAVLLWCMEHLDEKASTESFYELLTFTLSRSLILRTLQQSKTMPAQAKLKMEGATEEKIATTMATLEREFQETLLLCLEKLILLSEQLVASPKVLAATKIVILDLLREITRIYSADLVKGPIATILMNTQGQMKPETRAILESSIQE